MGLGPLVQDGLLEGTGFGVKQDGSLHMLSLFLHIGNCDVLYIFKYLIKNPIHKYIIYQ